MGHMCNFHRKKSSNPRILAIFSGLCSWTQRDHRSLRRSQPGLDAPQFPGTGGDPRYRLHEKKHEIMSSAIGLARFSIFYTYFLWGWCAVLSGFFFGSCVEVDSHLLSVWRNKKSSVPFLSSGLRPPRSQRHDISDT